ncbi:MAG: hypothetical protein ACFB10_13065 [Salibacteraceae bacterium]
MNIRSLLLTLFALLMLGLSTYAGGKKDKKSRTDENRPHLVQTQTAITPLGDDRIEFRMIKNDRSTVKVRILTNSGSLIYVDRIRKNNQVRTTYDIAEFPAGQYRIEVIENGTVVAEKVITKDRSTATY